MLHSLRRFLRTNLFINEQKGAVLPLLAVVIVALITVVSITVDVARVFAAQNRFQHAADAALLGGVATYNTNICLNDPNKLVTTPKQRLDCEVERLFLSNTDISLALNYMQARINNFVVTEIRNSTCVTGYNLTFDVEVPLKLFGEYHQVLTQRFNILSQTNASLSCNPGSGAVLELTLVLDTTQSMQWCTNGSSPCPLAQQKITGLKTAATNLINALFASADPNKVFVSIVPYNQVVDLQNYGSPTWLQPDEFATAYNSPPVVSGSWTTNCPATLAWPANQYLYFQNRDRSTDSNLGVPYDDADDIKPNSSYPNTLFHLPRDYDTDLANLPNPVDPDGYVRCAFKGYTQISPMIARSKSKQDLLNVIANLKTGYATRINVGMMWGAATLSPNWTGIWNNNIPGVLDTDPAPYHSATANKVMILMTDGKNEVPSSSFHYTVANDDASLSAICAKARANGITLYVVGFGADAIGVNQAHHQAEQVLKDCSGAVGTNPVTYPNYYHAADSLNLNDFFLQTLDRINEQTLRLTQ